MLYNWQIQPIFFCNAFIVFMAGFASYLAHYTGPPPPLPRGVSGQCPPGLHCWATRYKILMTKIRGVKRDSSFSTQDSIIATPNFAILIFIDITIKLHLAGLDQIWVLSDLWIHFLFVLFTSSKSTLCKALSRTFILLSSNNKDVRIYPKLFYPE